MTSNRYQNTNPIESHRLVSQHARSLTVREGPPFVPPTLSMALRACTRCFGTGSSSRWKISRIAPSALPVFRPSVAQRSPARNSPSAGMVSSAGSTPAVAADLRRELMSPAGSAFRLLSRPACAAAAVTAASWVRARRCEGGDAAGEPSRDEPPSELGGETQRVVDRLATVTVGARCVASVFLWCLLACELRGVEGGREGGAGVRRRDGGVGGESSPTWEGRRAFARRRGEAARRGVRAAAASMLSSGCPLKLLVSHPGSGSSVYSVERTPTPPSSSEALGRKTCHAKGGTAEW